MRCGVVCAIIKPSTDIARNCVSEVSPNKSSTIVSFGAYTLALRQL